MMMRMSPQTKRNLLMMMTGQAVRKESEAVKKKPAAKATKEKDEDDDDDEVNDTKSPLQVVLEKNRKLAKAVERVIKPEVVEYISQLNSSAVGC